MAEGPNNQKLTSRNALNHRRVLQNRRQPFWLPAINFYILAAAIAIAAFFLMWWILQDGIDKSPWIPAGILASIILAAAVIVREVILRTRRNQLLLAQERLDHNLDNVYRQRYDPHDEHKLSLEKNAEILKDIARKSEAANILGRLPEAHWEVFELCHEYLHLSEKEIETARAGSPRIPALTKSREKVQELHKFHLFTWSSAESRTLIQEAKNSVTITKKLELATKALNIIDSAIEFYPGEIQLIESANAVKEFVTSVKVSHWIEQAERSVFKGNYKRAINHYRDALFYLARENVRNSERDLIAEKINLEIEKVNKLISEKRKISSSKEYTEGD